MLQQRRFFHGRDIRGAESRSIEWFEPSGNEMSQSSWNTGYARCLGVMLRGDRLDVNEYGETISGDTLLVLFNADHELNIPFVLPQADPRRQWSLAFDTFLPEWGGRRKWKPRKPYPLRACSVAVFRAEAIPRRTAVP